MPKNLKLFYEKYEMLFLAAFVIFLLSGTYMLFSVLFGNPDSYGDTDPYIRALRIEEMLKNGTWAETVFPYSNYPFGEILHWTRPLDVIWIAMAYPVMFFTDTVREAIFLSGWFVSPLFNLLSCLVLVWALKPYTSTYLRLIAVILFMLQISLMGIYAFFRPDHHSLLSFLVVAGIACYLVYINKATVKPLVFMGACLGLMIWIAGEGFVFTYTIIGTLVLLWFAKQARLSELFWISAGLFVVVLFGWLVNPPLQGWFFPQNDRISALTALITGLTFLSFWAMTGLDKKGRLNTLRSKVFYMGAFTVLSVLAVLALFGTEAVLASPVDSSIQSIWQQRILEMKPIKFLSVQFFAYTVTPMVAIVISTALLAWRMDSSKQTRIILFLLLPLIVYTGLTFWAIRFSPYAAAISVFSVILVLSVWVRKANVAAKLSARFSHKKRTFGIVLFMFVISVYIIGLTALVFGSFKGLIVENPKTNIAYISLMGKEGTVLTDVFFAPNVIWKTGRAVVGTPYHHNVEGIKDNHDMFFLTDIDEIRKLFLKHQVTDVMLTGSLTLDYYDISSDVYKNRFYYKLLKQDKYPCWLDLDTSLLDYGVLLYHVNKQKMEDDCLF